MEGTEVKHIGMVKSVRLTMAPRAGVTLCRSILHTAGKVASHIRRSVSSGCMGHDGYALCGRAIRVTETGDCLQAVQYQAVRGIKHRRHDQR